MDDSKTIWCGNLSDKVTEEILFELFLQIGPLENVRIATDKEGRKSNFAFITFKHEQSVDYAIKLLNRIRLFDKSILVQTRNVNKSTEKNSDSNHLKQEIGFSRPVPQQKPHENREIYRSNSNHEHFQGSRNFRENSFREERYSPYNRFDERDRYDSNRKGQNYDRRNNFIDRGNRKDRAFRNHDRGNGNRRY